MKAQMISYLLSFSYGHRSTQDCRVRTTQELRTLAECIDALMTGSMGELGVILMQRFKGLENGVTDGFAVASSLEVMQGQSSDLATPEEERLLARMRLPKAKLEDAKKGRSSTH